jgi:transposase
MKATFLKRAFGIDKGWEYQSTKYVRGGMELHLEAKREDIRCPHCRATHIALRGGRERRIRSVPIGMKAVTIVAKVPRCQCRECFQYFDFSPLLPPEGDPTLIALNDLLSASAG